MAEERLVLLQTQTNKTRKKHEKRKANAILVPGMYFYVTQSVASVRNISYTLVERYTHLGVL